MKFNVLDFFMASLQIAFIVLKICGVINWPWLMVFLPLVPLFFLFVGGILLFLYEEREEKKEKKERMELYGTTNPLAIRMKKLRKEQEEMQRKINEKK